VSDTAPATEQGHLRSVLADGVLRLTIDHESRLNALTGGTMRGIVSALEQPGTDESVRVVVLTGAGRAFCSGADLTDIGGDDADPEAIMAGAERLVRAVLETPVPVVARVNGPAVGIGMSLALAADLAYLGPEAYLLQSFLSIGLMPDGGSTLLLAAAMGRARANEAVLRRRRIPGTEAAACGLVAGAADTTDGLDALVEAAVTRVAAAPRRAVTLAKAAMAAAAVQGIDHALAREGVGQCELLRSADFAERSRALLSRSTARP